MELVIILFLVGAGYAAKTALEHSRKGYRSSKDEKLKEAGKAFPKGMPKSRRRSVARKHATGYWLSALLHGFPVARAGWHAGWLAHQTAAEHTRAVREEARTTHLETKASFTQAIRDHKRRQAEARAEMDAAEAPDIPEAVQEAVVLHPDFPRPAPEPDSCPDHGPFPTREPGPFCGACGHVGTLADPLISVASANVPIHRSHTTDPGSGFHGETEVPAPSATGGTPVSDTTFATVIDAAKGSAASSEGQLASLTAERQKLEHMADEMLAQGVDSASVGQVMDMVDGYRKAEEAMSGIQDTAAALPQGLQQRHGGLDEAHREAPVPAAERTFYGEG